jgi:hypothetical protein
LGLSSLGWPLRYSQSRLCSIDNRLVDTSSFLEFVGSLEPVSPLNKNEILLYLHCNHGSKQIEEFVNSNGSFVREPQVEPIVSTHPFCKCFFQASSTIDSGNIFRNQQQVELLQFRMLFQISNHIQRFYSIRKRNYNTLKLVVLVFVNAFFIMETSGTSFGFLGVIF